MKRVLQTLFFLVLIPSFILGQGKFKVSGKVTDAAGEPLIGANVMIRVLNAGNTTDFDGNYSFEIPNELAKNQRVELTASFINYKKKSFTVVLNGSNIKQDFVLEEDLFQNEEIVVTGISSKTSKSVADVAVSRINASELTAIQNYQGISQLLSGKVSGVQMSQASGNIGGGYRFQMRAGGGINGDGQPVIYVDGVRMNNAAFAGTNVGGQDMSMLNLNPNDIESLEILKGPAAAATYGTSGSNGVVIIKTKSGKFAPGTGSPFSIGYKFNFGFNEQSIKYKTDDFVTANDANGIFKRGPISDHYITFTGGNPSLKYFGSYNRRTEEGIVSNTEGTTNSFRLNLNAVPTEKLTLNLSTSYTDVENFRPNNDNNIFGEMGNTMLQPVSYQFTAKDAILAFKDSHKSNKATASLQGTYTFIKDLEAYFAIGIDQIDYINETQYPFGYRYGGDTEGVRNVNKLFQRRLNFDFNIKYTYELIDELNVTSVVGAQANDNNQHFSTIAVKKFATNKMIGYGGGADVTGKNETSLNNREAGMFTEHQLNYQNTYMMSFALRKDWASTLGSEGNSIVYPKVSGAVRFDKLFELPSFVNLLKLRGAFGVNGQLPGSTDAIALTWTSAASGYGAAARINSIGNPDLKPEKINEFEIGLDAELFNSLSIEFTHYRQNANESIVNVPQAPSDGFGAFNKPFNIGALENYGFETMIKYNPIRSAEYDLNLSFIWNYQTSKVTDLGGQQPIYDGLWGVNAIAVGQPKHEFYYMKNLGAAYSAVTGAFSGVRNSASNDRISYGNPLPDHSGSITINFRFLKNFNLFALAEWALNNKVLSTTQSYMTQFGNWVPYNTLRAKLATQTIGTAEYKATAEEMAKLHWGNTANYVKDAGYLAFRELSLSYNFGDLLQDYDLKTYVRDLVVGISARNILRISEFEFTDFEVNSTGSRSLTRGNEFLTLQNPRTVNFWIQVGF